MNKLKNVVALPLLAVRVGVARGLTLCAEGLQALADALHGAARRMDVF